MSQLHDAVASGGLQRPHRLVYPAGARLTVRPDGQFGPAWAGTAAGIVPAPGEASGWLQAVLRDDGEVQVVHPAVIAPAGVSPYALIGYRDQLRFSAFDPAEAAGRDAAFVYAALVDEGDMIRIEVPPGSGLTDIREVTGVEAAGAQVRITTTSLGGEQRTDPHSGRDRVEVMIPGRHPAEDSLNAGRLFAPRPYQIRPGPAEDLELAAALARTAGPAPGQDDDRLTVLENRVAELERELGRLRGTGTPAGPADWHASLSMGEALGRHRPHPGGPGAAPDPHGWGAAADSTGPLLDAQAQAQAAAPELGAQRTWRRLMRLTGDAGRLAGDAHAGRLRFGDPARAGRAWRDLWTRVCEVTGDLAAALMTRLRRGSRGWRAASRLHHAAAEAVAHAHGWLPRGQQLPLGSYTPPRGRTGRTATIADLGTQLHDRGATPLGARDALTGLDYPGELREITLRVPPPRAPARSAAARARRPAPPSARR